MTNNKRVRVGDRVRIVNAVADSRQEYGYGNGDEYEVMRIYSEEPHIWPDGTVDSEIYLEDDEYEIITEKETDTVTEETKAQRLARLRAEVAELETEIIGEMTAGTVVIIVEHDDDDREVPVGSVMKVRHVDIGDAELPFNCVFIDGSSTHWLPLDAVMPVTREEARAHLIAQIERQLDEAYGKDSE